MKGAPNIAAELSVQERVLLFCLASGTESNAKGRPEVALCEVVAATIAFLPAVLPMSHHCWAFGFLIFSHSVERPDR